MRGERLRDSRQSKIDRLSQRAGPAKTAKGQRCSVRESDMLFPPGARAGKRRRVTGEDEAVLGVMRLPRNRAVVAMCRAQTLQRISTRGSARPV